MSLPSEASLCPETGTMAVAPHSAHHDINVNAGNVGALGHGSHVAGYGGHGGNAGVYVGGGGGTIHHAGAGHHEGVTRFALRWNDYQTSLSTAFEMLRSDDDLVDVTLGCQGRKFSAHKMMLSACSPYFRELFRGNPCAHPIIILRDTRPEDLSAILQFMYRGEVSLESTQLDTFLKAAAALQIRGLTESHDHHASGYYSRQQNAASSASKRQYPVTRHSSKGPKRRKYETPKSKPGSVKQEVLGADEQAHHGGHGHQQNQFMEHTLAGLDYGHAAYGEGDGTIQPAALLEEGMSEHEEGLNSDDGQVGDESKDENTQCQHCGKSFRSKNALLDHEHSHDGTTTCHICGRVCSTRGNLKKHLAGVHKAKYEEAIPS